MSSNLNDSYQPVTAAPLGPGVIDAKHEPHRRYRLIGQDDQEILRTAGQLLEGSHLLENHPLRIANVIAVFKKIAAWCEARSPRVAMAFLTSKSQKLTLHFVPAAPRYDIELDEAMTELEVELGGSACVGVVESFQIPERSIEQFVSDDAVLLWQRPQTRDE